MVLHRGGVSNGGFSASILVLGCEYGVSRWLFHFTPLHLGSMAIENKRNRLAKVSSRSPFRTFAVALVILGGVLSVALWWSLHQPWLGISTVPVPERAGLRVVAVWPDGPAAGILAIGDLVTGLGAAEGEVLLFDRYDFVSDPDLLPTFAQLNEFLSRQEQLAIALSAPVTRIRTMDGRVAKVQALPARPLLALPMEFWWYQFYAAVALLVGVWVWTTAGSRLPAVLLLASGLSFVVLSTSISLIVTREIALSADSFRWLLAIYHLGNNLFSLFLLALLWNYPSRLGARYVYWLFALWVAVAWLNERFQWYDLPGHNVGFQVTLFIMMAMIVIIAQWRRSRGRPADRAVVKFLIVSIVFLNTLGLLLYYHAAWASDSSLVPLVVSLGIVMSIYLALVAGVLRYRLFDLDRWWLHLWIWLAAGVAILGMDVLISVALPGLSRYSLIIALLFIGWIYFPFRQWVWEKIFPVSAMSRLPDQLTKLILRIISDRRFDADAAWRGLLKEIFMPLEMEVSKKGSCQPHLLSAGERLYVPGVRCDGYELCLANHGGRLFGPQDVELVAAMHETVSRLDTQLEQYRRGVALERERIMRDLHDDVGGRLLTLVHECDGRRVSRIAREALDALREVIYFSMDTDSLVGLADVVGRWRSQLQDRLEQQGVDLEWDWDTDALAGFSMPAMDVLNIDRILHEAVSNALRHAKPRMIQVTGRVVPGELLVTIANDGVQLKADEIKSEGDFGGKGIHNMKRRTKELGGSLSIDVSEDVYRVELRVPLPGIQQEDE